ncbi:virulence RhuM family protein [Desulfitobacterium sp. AusDCA]
MQNIFKDGELDVYSVCQEFRHTGTDGKEYNTKFHNLNPTMYVINL